ncbi:MAG TPA: hypothetical protein VKY85_12335 [Candidatus Angelobacter sp.]|nr:hypothetical protein [Candidatus Angelobacter sp.]
MQAYEDPFSSALGAPGSVDLKELSHINGPEFGANSGGVIQTFAESFWSKSGTRTARTLPIKVSFPAFGPSVFLVSELTAENHAEEVELSYQHDKKGGVR